MARSRCAASFRCASSVQTKPAIVSAATRGARPRMAPPRSEKNPAGAVPAGPMLPDSRRLEEELDPESRLDRQLEGAVLQEARILRHALAHDQTREAELTAIERFLGIVRSERRHAVDLLVRREARNGG